MEPAFFGYAGRLSTVLCVKHCRPCYSPFDLGDVHDRAPVAGRQRRTRIGARSNSRDLFFCELCGTVALTLGVTPFSDHILVVVRLRSEKQMALVYTRWVVTAMKHVLVRQQRPHFLSPLEAVSSPPSTLACDEAIPSGG